nr:ATPase, F1/V1/A1 complex, alpha/beta subunit, zinc knuckle CX2CX4HX4C [Tanacetum cinerariifolium]
MLISHPQVKNNQMRELPHHLFRYRPIPRALVIDPMFWFATISCALCSSRRHHSSKELNTDRKTYADALDVSLVDNDRKLECIPIEIDENGVEVVVYKSSEKNVQSENELRLCNVPVEAWTMKGVSALTSRIGKPLIMDSVTASKCKQGIGLVRFARVLIEAKNKDQVAKDKTPEKDIKDSQKKEVLVDKGEWIEEEDVLEEVSDIAKTMQGNAVKGMEDGELWKDLEIYRRIVRTDPWLLSGDMNVTLASNEHSVGGSNVSSDMKDF